VPCCFRLSVCGANHNECAWRDRRLIAGQKVNPTSDKREKQRNRGANLFDRGVSLLRDMLSAGVVDCLAGEFDDAKVSVLCCVLSVRSPLWQILQIR